MCRLHMSCFHSFATLLLLFSIEVYVFTKLLPNTMEFLKSLLDTCKNKQQLRLLLMVLFMVLLCKDTHLANLYALFCR